MKQDIILGDCLEKMKDIKDGEVSLVLTDPPYLISKANNFKSMKGRAGIDFGEWDKNADILSYIAEVFRILNKNGSFIVFNSWRNLGQIAAFAENIGFITKDMLRIEKKNPMPRNRDRRYVTDYECAIWFTMPNAKWIFNRQEKTYQRPKFVVPIDKGLHPTQKSLALMEELIKIHSNENDLVLDCFAGSGTTGLACKNLNRQFILIEKDQKYYDIEVKRLK